MRRIGLVVNPIAGMGGRVGLKGTDNKVEEARRRGAEPRAPDRARQALEHLEEQSTEVAVYTYGGVMGEDEAVAAGFEPTVVGRPDGDETSTADTRAAVRALVDADVDLILFVGGDGTAVDVAETLDELDDATPILGVPGGVKVYSSVFAVTPRAAGRIATTFERTERREVNDIDEDAYRGGDVNTELKALAEVPVGDEIQSSKQIGGGTVEALAEAVAAEVDPETTYVLGPGSTVDAVKTELGFNGSPLGVDVWRGGEVVARDAGESDILDALGERNVIVVSPIGGQGFIFGRGNDQISPPVIRQSDIEVVASKQKLKDIGVLRVDTGDPELDEALRGWMRVRVGKFERQLLKVV
ncbi:homolog to NAD kinase [Natronomonas pharaonis DSM 2160]|uniref:Homolog to NAD kinase n=1 Tax=Natronomonas pharaonis (strain ATCC 35678 / DSM 2160 / CIP 103997 / JCM 8858 / NBRC 14720 / NCIMB 2260 / Gabara) TaxID=348780 RepID=A0A1U7EY59_NATPD|nr:ATP-NAD kinase family protein [Natronomonas pharaonis]CAI50139.1 homolog to NAD kinase [Natronomonas pharaonis DSM 2160]